MDLFVRRLDENLAHLRAVSKRFQEQLIEERTSATPAETQNTFYQLGDFVFFERDKSVPRPNKLAPDFHGPFEVLSQNKNDVSTRNLVEGISCRETEAVLWYPYGSCRAGKARQRSV
jgi:hypothetical protein